MGLYYNTDPIYDLLAPGAFTLEKDDICAEWPTSYSQIEAVRHYIQNQREHHQTKTFEEEYMTLLKLHRIEFESRYLFENEYCGWFCR